MADQNIPSSQNNELCVVQQLLQRASTLLVRITPTHNAGEGHGIDRREQSPASPNTNQRITTQLPSSSVQTPTSSRQTTQELRDIFQPYQRGNQRTALRTANRRSAVPQREWSHRFFCLGGPEDHLSPTVSRRVLYQEAGLGEAMITTTTSCNSVELKRVLQNHFQMLSRTNFEILRCLGGGAGKPLIKISSAENIPSVATLISSRAGIIYIRPFSSLYINEAIDNEITDQRNETTLPPAENIIPSQSISILGEIDNFPQVADPTEGQVRAAESTAFQPTDILTLEQLRTQIYQENQGVQIVIVERSEFLSQVLGVYKDPDFNIYKKPHVKFIGELGRDVGGITKEYFYKAFLAITNEKFDNRYVALEGENDHKIPSKDAMLLRAGVYKTIGKLMVHSLIHTGVAFLGLSNAVVEYICTEDIDSQSFINIDNEDISSYETRELVRMLENWQISDLQPSNEVMNEIKETATEAGYNGDITYEMKSTVKEIIKMHHVIDMRKAALDDMKLAFAKTPLLKFLNARPYLWECAFPRMSTMQFSCEDLMEKIDVNGDPNGIYLQFLRELIESLSCEQRKELVFCWTAWPLLPTERMVMTVEEGMTFQIRTCFYTMYIPSTFSKEEFFQNIHRVLSSGGGFGNI